MFNKDLLPACRIALKQCGNQNSKNMFEQGKGCLSCNVGKCCLYKCTSLGRLWAGKDEVLSVSWNKMVHW